MKPRKRPPANQGRPARLAAAVALVAAPLARGTDFDTIGLTALLNMDPTLTGAGVGVAQVESNDSMVSNAFNFEVNPSYVGQPAGLFTYIQPDGSVSTTFNPSQESGHADFAGDIFYGTPSGHFGLPGVVPGLSRVDSYYSHYFGGTLIPDGIPIPDAIANLDFSVVPSLTLPQAVAVQEASDTAFDNYIAEFGTIMVFALDNTGGTPYPLAPATAYNGIAVSCVNASSSDSTTIDNGRSKPDISAPGNLTSFAIPLISGSAAILVQAGARGDGGDSPTLEADAVDFRTVKALLLNGADKSGVPFTRTPVEPLDPENGAGRINIYNAYMQLTAGRQPASSTASTVSAGGPHAPVITGTSPTFLNGWDFATLASSPANDAYANYLFQTPGGTTSFSFTATMDWERPFNPNTAAPIGINTFGLYLYDLTSNRLLDFSNSGVDNVQDVYDTELAPGHSYDLEVLKNGGAAQLTNSETYAIAFSNSANPAGFLGNIGIWNSSGGGSWPARVNWYNGDVPQQGGESANFTDAATAPVTITLDAHISLGNINFYNTNSYTIAAGSGGGTLAIGNGNVGCDITDAGGTHFITAPVVLNSPLTVTVVNSGDSLSMTGGVSGPSPLSLSGQGTLILGGSNSYAGGTMIGGGTLYAASHGALPASSSVVVGNVLIAGHLRLGNGIGTISLSSLQINAGSLVDIGNNAVAINYGAIYNDPIFDVVTNLLSGYNGGAWTGTAGIISTAAQSSTDPAVSIGYTDGAADSNVAAVPNQVLISYTLAGDANLDGMVDFTDLVAVIQNFRQFGTDWAHGNFTYGERTDFADLVVLIQNFNKTLPEDDSIDARLQNVPLVSATDVQLPEPGWTGAAFVCVGALVAKRRGRRVGKVR